MKISTYSTLTFLSKCKLAIDYLQGIKHRPKSYRNIDSLNTHFADEVTQAQRSEVRYQLVSLALGLEPSELAPEVCFLTVLR